MPLFFTILLFTLLFLALCGSVVAAICVWVEEWRTVRVRWGISGASLLAFVGLLTLAVSLIGHDDPSAHCAAGTRYVEQSHLVGKTVVTDWWCVPA